MKSDLSPTTRHVLDVLALHMDDKASCFPSIRVLCEETGLSNRTVIDHLKIAEAAGWIRVELAGRGGQGWKRNRYIALNPLGSELPSPRLEGKGGEAGSPPSRERGEANDGNVVKEVHTNSTKNSTNIYADQFEQFWDNYPRRAGGNSKREALKAWNARRRDGVSSEALIYGALRYAAFCDATDRTGTQFVKQAKAFLGPNEHWRERWDLPEALSEPPDMYDGLAELDAMDAAAAKEAGQ